MKREYVFTKEQAENVYEDSERIARSKNNSKTIEEVIVPF